MLEQLPTRDSADREGRTDRRSTRETDAESSVVFGTSLGRIGRVLFGGVLAFMAADNLRNLEGRTQYAEAKGAPAASVTVPVNSAGLLLGGLGVALWRFPRAAATAVASFFISVTPLMHDFWNAEDEEAAQQEQIHFLKNAALAGAALALLDLDSGRDSDRD